jgi:hypothetical protein
MHEEPDSVAFMMFAYCILMLLIVMKMNFSEENISFKINGFNAVI